MWKRTSVVSFSLCTKLTIWSESATKLKLMKSLIVLLSALQKSSYQAALPLPKQPPPRKACVK